MSEPKKRMVEGIDVDAVLQKAGFPVDDPLSFWRAILATALIHQAKGSAPRERIEEMLMQARLALKAARSLNADQWGASVTDAAGNPPEEKKRKPWEQDPEAWKAPVSEADRARGTPIRLQAERDENAIKQALRDMGLQFPEAGQTR